MRLIATAIAGIVFFILTLLILTPFGAGVEDIGIPMVFIGAAIVAFICIIAPTGRRAWGRGFLLDGILLIAAPILIVPLINRSFLAVTKSAGAVASSDLEVAATNVGAGLGSAMAFGVTTFLGLIFGSIFIILGLVMVLGGRRDVIVVERRTDERSGHIHKKKQEPTFRLR